MDATEITVPICAGFVSFFVLLFGTLVLMRWFRHKETLAMIQQGMVPPDVGKKNNNGKGMLIWGVGIAFFGLALLGTLAILGGFLTRMPVADSGGGVYFAVLPLVPGLVVLFLGIALVIVYVITRPGPAAEREQTPGAPADEEVDWPQR
jgi:hypothetical protein